MPTPAAVIRRLLPLRLRLAAVLTLPLPPFVFRCEIHHNGSYGIYAMPESELTLSKNKSYENGRADVELRKEKSGLFS